MFLEIWKSFRRMPLWVQVWVSVVLMPANLLSLAFLGQPGGMWVALLAIGGMALNMPIIFTERGFSKMMALPHIAIWTPLVFVILALLPQSNGLYQVFLLALLVINLISLAFDYPDAWKWWQGDRAIA